jgi:16S rRNA (guanine527-N7)-methyltransferase
VSTHPANRPELPRDAGRLPPLPDAFWTALDAGLPALGLSLTSEARSAIDAHIRLLLAWNAAINLTAITAPEAIAIRHVLDSLSGAPLLPAPRRATGAVPPIRVLDIGSGGGFPGLPIAAALPQLQLTLGESVAKKARFLEAAVDAMGLGARVRVAALRAEALAGPGLPRTTFDVVTVRAVARLDELVELAMPLLRVGGRLHAWKSGDLSLINN